MKLFPTGIDPDVEGSPFHVGVSRQTKTGGVKQKCEGLVRHGDIDVFESEDIADIAPGSVESLFSDSLSSKVQETGLEWSLSILLSKSFSNETPMARSLAAGTPGRAGQG